MKPECYCGVRFEGIIQSRIYQNALHVSLTDCERGKHEISGFYQCFHASLSRHLRCIRSSLYIHDFRLPGFSFKNMFSSRQNIPRQLVPHFLRDTSSELFEIFRVLIFYVTGRQCWDVARRL